VGERLYVRNVVDRDRLAFANSVIHAAAAIGIVVGPIVGGIYADANDLRAPFVLASVLSLIVSAVAIVVLPARLHPRSAVLEPAEASPTDANLPALDRRGLTILIAANVPFVAGYGSFVTTFVPFANEGLHWSSTQVGLAFSLFALGNVVGAPILGWAADRFGRVGVGVLSSVPIVAFAAALVIAAPDGVLFVLAFGAGAGVAGYTAAWFALVGVATGRARGGTSFGAVLAITSLGTVIGAVLAGAIWEAVDIRAQGSRRHRWRRSWSASS
jgi:MFS family permease